jgi:N-acetyl-gamma-glutamyl-phosphate/LysW-gamma-L-alpha-aminoadipyl-6-phosphate reductase
MTERVKQMNLLKVGIVGGSGYAGGELLRLLLHHPQVQVTQVTANRHAGRFLHQVHPHLRGRTSLKFISQEVLEACDLLFLALPHGEAQSKIQEYAFLADRLIDLSADFRLSDPAAYAAIYGAEHAAPDWLEKFAYGLPELNREAIRGSRYVSGVGCNATATHLAIYPLVKAGLLKDDQALISDIKVGSSEAGSTPTESSHHPVRSGVVRPFQLTGHRHAAEVRQMMAPYGDFQVRLSITSVELVRGVYAMVHIKLPTGLEERDLWSIYRSAWGAEPFVRIIHEKQGNHRHPEPKLIAGTNYADVGWDYDPQSGDAVLLCAIDNLGKGAAGTALQCMNLICDFEEETGLEFGGYYP